MTKDTIIILSARHRANSTMQLADEITKAGYTAKILNPNKLHPYISNRSGWDLLYDNYYRDKPQRIHIGRVLAVIPRIASNLNFTAFAVEHLNKNNGIYTPQTAEAIKTASSKIATLQKCSNAGIKVPRTMFIKDKFDIEFIIRKLGLPFIYKTVTGSQGTGVAILNDKMSAVSVLQSTLKDKKPLILQEFIKSKKTQDIRAIVVGDKVIAAELRQTNKKDEFRSNLSLDGGFGRKIELDAETKRFCVKASKTVGLDISGVDIMFDTSGEPVLIEVNTNFGWKIAKVTGINIAKCIVDYTISKAKKHNGILSKNNNPFSVIEHSSYINQAFKIAEGKKIDYSDRNGNEQSILINDISDMYQIMENIIKFN